MNKSQTPAVSQMAVTAMLCTTNFQSRCMKVVSRNLSGSPKRYSCLYAFDRKICTYYPETRSVVIFIKGMSPTGVRTSVLNHIPGVTITKKDNELFLNGEKWDGDRHVINLPRETKPVS